MPNIHHCLYSITSSLSLISDRVQQSTVYLKKIFRLLRYRWREAISDFFLSRQIRRKKTLFVASEGKRVSTK